MKRSSTSPSLKLSLIPVAVLLVLIVINVTLFRENASSGPNQFALLFAALISGLLGHLLLASNYREVELKALKSIVLAMEAILILLVVGALIGMWIVSGVVPTLIYYGVKIINPSVFLLVACIVCSLVSSAVGSSWSTMGTVGVALIGIGRALGFSDGLIAGAVISGAYLGDKLSPLSDTTNLAPAVAGSTLFTHIRHMLYTTVPTYTLTLIGFTVIGLFHHGGTFDSAAVENILGTLTKEFTIHPALLLIPVAVIGLVLARMPAIPALVIGALMGAVAALFLQRHQLGITGEFSWSSAYGRLVDIAYNGFKMQSGNPTVDGLLSRGGLMNMVNTVILILMAMLFGGAMEATGMLPRIAEAILQRVRGPRSLIAATVWSCVVCNIVAAEQYLAIVIPGRMFRTAYRDQGLAPRNLSRALEDGGTVTSVLVPWNTCGAFASAALGVPTLTYLPYCLFNLIGPCVSTLLATLSIGIRPLDADTVDSARVLLQEEE